MKFKNKEEAWQYFLENEENTCKRLDMSLKTKKSLFNDCWTLVF